MKKIIILKGISNVGKSTILNQLINWLLNNHTQTNNIKIEGNKVDRYGLIEIKGYKIGIITEGDRYHHTVMRLNEIHNQNCDVIVCCCRTRLSSYTAVKEFIHNHNNPQKSYLPIWINLLPAVNNLQSNQTLLELKAYLKGI